MRAVSVALLGLVLLLDGSTLGPTNTVAAAAAAAASSEGSAGEAAKPKVAAAAADDDEVDEFDDLDQWEDKKQKQKQPGTPTKTDAPATGDGKKKAAKPAGNGNGKKQPAGDAAAKKKKQQQMLEKQKTLKAKQEASGVTPTPAAEGGAEPAAAAAEDEDPDLTVEVICMTLILIYTVNYAIGSRKNKAVAQTMHDQCKEEFVALFTQVGTHEGQTLIEESANEFCMYGSGKRFCRKMSMTVTVPPRHDLVQVLQEFLKPQKPDFLEVVIEMEPDAFEGFVFAICQNRSSKQFVGARRDVSAIAKKHDGRQWKLPQNLAVHTTNTDIVKQLLTPSAVSFLNEFGDALVGLHFSDKYMGVRGNTLQEKMNAEPDSASNLPTMQQMLVMQFNLTVGEEGGLSVAKVVKAAGQFIDSVGRARLSPQGKKDVEKSWDNYIALLSKENPREMEQRAQKSKFDKEKAEKEKYEAMDYTNPARQKWERQQEKKALKAKAKRGMKMMKM